jgi:catechol 2,3-dioxygenase-like lactoylglutathione lyase family enzyme
MRFVATPCVAIGATDVEAAASFYREVLGFTQTGRSGAWTELSSGPFKFYVGPEYGRSPMLEVKAEAPLETAIEYLVARGCELLERGEGEAYVRDPFGRYFCVSGTD